MTPEITQLISNGLLFVAVLTFIFVYRSAINEAKKDERIVSAARTAVTAAEQLKRASGISNEEAKEYAINSMEAILAGLDVFIERDIIDAFIERMVLETKPLFE